MKLCSSTYRVSLVKSHIASRYISTCSIDPKYHLHIYTQDWFLNVVFRNKHFKQNNITISTTKQMQYTYVLILLYVTLITSNVFSNHDLHFCNNFITLYFECCHKITFSAFLKYTLEYSCVQIFFF